MENGKDKDNKCYLGKTSRNQFCKQLAVEERRMDRRDAEDAGILGLTDPLL